MKKPIISVLLILTLGLGFALFIKTLYFYFIREQANPNSIKVEVEHGISSDDVLIEWSSYQKTATIFEDGKDLKIKYKKYGKNSFTVYYQGKIIGNFEQFKHNNWHGHSYTFLLTKENEGIITSWIVEGPDSEKVYKID